jgi:hypothetical protein
MIRPPTKTLMKLKRKIGYEVEDEEVTKARKELTRMNIEMDLGDA